MEPQLRLTADWSRGGVTRRSALLWLRAAGSYTVFGAVLIVAVSASRLSAAVQATLVALIPAMWVLPLSILWALGFRRARSQVEPSTDHDRDCEESRPN